MFSILQTDGPHVIQPAHRVNMLILYAKHRMSMAPKAKKKKKGKSNIPGISIITSKYPQFITIDCGPMCRPCHWQAETATTEGKTEF